MSWSSLRRRWPEAALILLLVAAGLLLDGLWRAVVWLVPAGVVVFAMRRRVADVLRAAAILVVLLLVAAVLSLTIDLGPVLRGMAEQYATRSILRPLHMERLSIHLASGRFVLDNVQIDPKRAGDKPFFVAKKIYVGLPWWRVATTRDLTVEHIVVEDWDLLIERWPGGLHNFPRFSGDSTKPKRKGPKLFTTTVQYVHMARGKVSYYDHGSWMTIAPNMDIVISHETGEYLGRGSASNGKVHVQGYQPMRADLRFAFKIDGAIVTFPWMQVDTDGTHSSLTGIIDISRWPEQTYNIVSDLDLFKMREVWFAGETWRMWGKSQFAGTYHLFKEGFELKGAFHSDKMRWNLYDLENMNGFLRWVPTRFEVTGGSARLYDGIARYTYTLAPLRRKTPALAHFDATYENVDLTKFSIGIGMTGLRLAGTATGRNLLEWPIGHYAQHRGQGEVVVTPPAGVTVLARDPQPYEEAIHQEPVMAGPEQNLAQFPKRTAIGGSLAYQFGPEWFEAKPGSHIATERTYVAFEGKTAYGERTQMPFYTRSADWQESDRFLAGMLTAFGSPTNVVKLGGWGEFEGVLTKSFSAPLVVGTFKGDGLRAWDVVWGGGTAEVSIENGYADVKDSVVRKDGSEIRAFGRFSLGYPRKDKGEEINARVVIKDRDMKDLRHAFLLDDWPVEGKLSGEYHLTGAYEGPYGFGGFSVRDGSAWEEPFDLATARLRFDGVGVRVDGFELKKSTGRITGAARVEWEGRYSFSGDGQAIPMESVALANFPQAPVFGVLQFTANGAGTFLSPRYDARFRIDDLYVKDEGVGQVTGTMGMRDTLVEATFEAASPRLTMSGKAQVELTEVYDSEMTLRFTDTSLDPYLRLFQPGMSPFARAVASGNVHVVGQLYNPDRLLVETTVDKVNLRLFDYDLANRPDRPIRVAFDKNVVRLQDVLLEGQDTKLQLTGTASIAEDRMNVTATGDANLGILQVFYRDIRSSGRASLSASITGPVTKPVISGKAVIEGGRIRPPGLPHSIQAINGTVHLDKDGIRMDEVSAQIANGRVQFGGRIMLNGFVPSQLALTANGTGMEFRYPEGFRSVVDADLRFVGSMESPTLGGTVNVKSAVYRRQMSSNLYELAGGLAAAASGSTGSTSNFGSLPLKFDIRVVTPPGALRIETNPVQIASSAELTLRGDLNHPLLFGRAEVDRGVVIYSGKRYLVTHGTIDFNNPSKIEPFFDIEAETRVRAPGQTYNVVVRLTGTPTRFTFPVSSDPPLPRVEIFALLLGDATRAPEAELGNFRRTETQGRLATQQAQQVLTGILSGNLTSAVEQAFGLDTFQISPSLFDPYQRNTSPGARVTVGKRISDKVYLTYSQSLNLNSPGGKRVVFLEYDQSDRYSWILSANEDNTYALDVRVRHVF